MKIAVITAYSRSYRDEQLRKAEASHLAFAERIDANFSPMALPHDGTYRKRKLWNVHLWIAKGYKVFWIDGDVIIPDDWQLPAVEDHQFYFPISRGRCELFASYWLCSRVSVDLLNAVNALQGMLPELEACTALNLTLRDSAVRPGRLMPLLHCMGEDLFKRERKLRCEALC